MKALFSLLLFFGSISAVSQKRIDEKTPDVKIIATIRTLAGWTKNDLGKWSTLQNALPQYNHSIISLNAVCERVNKIELVELVIKSKQYYCLAKFGNSFVKNNENRTIYTAAYWVFYKGKADTVGEDEPGVLDLVYSTVHIGTIFKSAPVTWKDISEDSFVNLSAGDSFNRKVCVQFREDTLNKKYQFLVGSYDEELHDFDGFSGCGSTDQNNQLKNGYYEVTGLVFENFFSLITN